MPSSARVSRVLGVSLCASFRAANLGVVSNADQVYGFRWCQTMAKLSIPILGDFAGFSSCEQRITLISYWGYRQHSQLSPHRLDSLRGASYPIEKNFASKTCRTLPREKDKIFQKICLYLQTSIDFFRHAEPLFMEQNKTKPSITPNKANILNPSYHSYSQLFLQFSSLSHQR